MKRVLGIILAALLVTASFAAYAIPSKTTGDLSQVLPTQGLIVYIPSDSTSADFVSAQTEIIAGLVAGGASLVSYFPEEVQGLIAASLPSGLTVEGLELNELVPLRISNYTIGSGDAEVALQFATPYADGQMLVPVLGIVQADGSIQWHVLTAKVVNGTVYLTIPADVMAQIGDKLVVLGILSQKAA